MLFIYIRYASNLDLILILSLYEDIDVIYFLPIMTMCKLFHAYLTITSWLTTVTKSFNLIQNEGTNGL